MKIATFFVILVLTVCLTVKPALCDDASSKVFEFSSGGAYHLSGIGEWILNVNSAGKMTLKHNIKGKVQDFGNFTLTGDENKKLWLLIDSLKVENMQTSTRPGIPDEIQYTFSLKSESGSYSARIWINDLREKSEVRQFTGYTKELIKKYTGKDAVLN